MLKGLYDRCEFPGQVLALDPGTHCGWAVRHIDGRIAHGTAHFAKETGEGYRWLRFTNWLNDWSRTQPVSALYFEHIDFAKGPEAPVIYGFQAMITWWGERNRVPYDDFGPKQIKKFATGTGNATKAEMMQAVRLWGFAPKDHNAADALAILHLGMERLAGKKKGEAA